MPIKKRKLTPGRLRVARVYAESGNVKLAAQEASLTVDATYKALHDPQVQALIKKQQLHLLVVKGVPVAVKALIDVAGDENEKGAARVMAAKAIGELAGLKPEHQAAAEDNASLAELKAMMATWEQRNGELAQVVEAEVVEIQPGGVFD